MKKHNRFFAVCIFTALSLLLLTACGGGGGSPGEAGPDTTIASIKIVPSATMLTQLGEQQALEAKAFNAAGEELQATFTWTSSHPDQVAIDADGLLTAQTLGSAEIKAMANGVTSESAIALMALPAVNARLITDEQIIGKPTPVDATAPYGLGFQYQITVRGSDPLTVGEILLGTGEVPVGGRIIAVAPAGQDVLVTLEIISIPEMFDKLVFNEEIDLSTASVTIPDAVTEFYDVQHNPDGSMLFTLKPDAPAVAGLTETRSVATRAALAIGTSANPFHPFVCEFPVSPFFSLNALSPSILLERDMSLPIEYDPDTGDLRRFSLKGRVKVGFKITNTLTAQFEAKAGCKYELTRITIPINGVLGLVYGGQVPLGLGFEVAGKVSLAGAGFTLGAEAEATMELGMSCPAGSSCGVISDFDRTGKATADWTLPDGFNPDAQLRFEPSLSGFAYAELKLGPSSSTLAALLSALDIGAFEFRAGPTLAANLAPVEGQVIDTNYASDYKLSLDLKAGPSQDISAILGVIGVNLINAQFTESNILTTSPAAQTVTVDTGGYSLGDNVGFNVKLDSTTVNFLPGLYNVDEVLIYRKIDNSGVISTELVASTTATDGQTDFDLNWVAIDSGSSADSFFAFVSTKLLPIPLLGELELKKATVAGTQKIAFVSDRNGGRDIYVMNKDGSNPVNLTQNSTFFNTGGLDWSPDGSRVAFHGVPGSNNVEIYTMNADGSNLINLTQNDGAFDFEPAWSPDGSKIMFLSERDSNREIYIMNADGSNLINLTQNSTFDDDPVWSPDGSKIAFVSDRNGIAEIYVMNADGSSLVRLTQQTDGSRGNKFPVWSPDGSKIAFEGLRPTIDLPGFIKRDIYVMDADGSNLVNLTQNDTTESNPAWSPDGSKIAFVKDRLDNFDPQVDIYVMDADGSNRVNLTQNINTDKAPIWSSDGLKIFFWSNRDGNIEIYGMNADGSNQVNLTQNSALDFEQALSP